MKIQEIEQNFQKEKADYFAAAERKHKAELARIQDENRAKEARMKTE